MYGGSERTEKFMLHERRGNIGDVYAKVSEANGATINFYTLLFNFLSGVLGERGLRGKLGAKRRGVFLFCVYKVQIIFGCICSRLALCL